MVDVALEQAGAHVDEELVPEGDDEVDNDELKVDDNDELKAFDMDPIRNFFVPHKTVMFVNATGHRLRVRGTLRSRRFFLQHINAAFNARDVSAEFELQWQEVLAAVNQHPREEVLDFALGVKGKERKSKVEVPEGEDGFNIVYSAYTSNNEDSKVCGKLPVNRHRKITFNGLGLATDLV